MPITKPVVLISSTAKDLAEHRKAAAEAARQAGFEAVMMEDFEAQTLKPPYPACMEKVRGCDVLVVLVAHRYGWVPPDQPNKKAKSITWLECEEILRAPKEVLVFVVDPTYKWPAELKESYRAAEAFDQGTFTPELQAEIERDTRNLSEFKAWLDSLGFRRKFTDPPSVNSEVQEQLNKWLKRHPDFHAATPDRNERPPAPPANRPRIAFRDWDQIPGDHPVPIRSGQTGFHLVNDGGAAYDVTVEPFAVESSVRARSETLARVGEGESAFALVWLEGHSGLAIATEKWDLLGALKTADAKATVGARRGPDFSLSVSVSYRDADGRWWFQSRARLTLIRSQRRISFSSTTHDRWGATREAVIDDPAMHVSESASGMEETRAVPSGSCDHGLVQPVFGENGQPTDEHECAICHARFSRGGGSTHDELRI